MKIVTKLAAAARDQLGLYFSVPFCRAKCTYCNFASGVFPASDHARYVDRLIEDLAAAPAWAKSMRAALPAEVDTIYFGGGTPVLLAPELLTHIFAAIRARYDIPHDAEITIECAPGQIADEMIVAMAGAGVNRVSLGVQSFVDSEAAASGRLHTRAAVMNDLQRFREAGIGNISIDLLAGLAGQTMASWRESLQVLAATGVPHASVYMLEIDEDSRLGRELISGGARYHAGLVPSDDAIALMYEQALDAFADAGLEQYEISNFARPGFQSRHNIRYWQRRPYLGFGLDASSMLHSEIFDEDGAVLRATTTDDLAEYLGSGGATLTHETSWLGSPQRLEEAWFLGLRCNEGVSSAAIELEFGREAAAISIAVAERLCEDGLLRVQEHSNGRRFRLTDRGRLLSNEVFAEFLGLRCDQTVSATPV
jgi:oxygen-independent coproporphyrinogen III oxidase